jgi:hypothetical protein
MRFVDSNIFIYVFEDTRDLGKLPKLRKRTEEERSP